MTADYVIRMYFEALKPTPEEARAMNDQRLLLVDTMEQTHDMTNRPNHDRRFYAAQSPRGFANEIMVHVFRSRADRDVWVSAHEDDGTVNSAACGAYAITAKRARAILGYRGDVITENFNSVIEH